MQPEAVVARLDERRAVSPDAYPWTDAGNAERFVTDHGDDVRYCYPWGRWLIWDGRRWQGDETGAVIRRAKATARRMLQAALDADDRKYLSFALASERDARIRAMLGLAQPDRPVLPAELDSDPWLLGVANGTLDLRTGKLHAHRREDLITKLAPVEYDEAATSDRWTAFLDRIFAADEELIAFVARLVGASVTGTPGMQRLPICWGTGANGKSTFLNVLQRLLGDYAHQAPPELLLHRDRARGGATPDLADLHGKRFVSAIETGEGKRLDEPLVKQLTGGDAITARRLYGHPFTFHPSHTIFLATNCLPEIRGSDLAIKRRVALVPFTVTIPDGEQRDQDELVHELLEEGPGILRWIVAGCAAWQRDGLHNPAIVSDATAAYLAEQDVLGAWIGDRCVTQPGVRAKSGDLYADYKAWADENREHVLTQRAFGARLGERGFTATRTKQARWWEGISLLAADRTLDDDAGDESR